MRPNRCHSVIGVMLIVFTVFMSSGCQKAYYQTMEKFGVHKRDLMVERVAKARNAQEEVKEQFKSALERFGEVVRLKDTDLSQKYERLNDELKQSESKAEAVSDRIRAVEDVAEALFEEWATELDQYTSAALRNKSRLKFEATRQHYKRLIGAMKRAEKKITPVLAAFRDQVLFFKHNLNAQAIASLEDELDTMETGVAALIKEMEASIKEADAFILALSR